MTDIFKVGVCGKLAVELPPLTHTFLRSSHEDLLGVKVGDDVKLLFSAQGFMVERMWVRVTKLDSDEWEGTLDNTPFALPAKYCDAVRFHPLAVVGI